MADGPASFPGGEEPLEPGPEWSESLTRPATKECPGCGASVKKRAVICVTCGMDFRTGAKMRTRLDRPAGAGRKPRALDVDKEISIVTSRLGGGSSPAALSMGSIIWGCLALVVLLSMAVFLAGFWKGMATGVVVADRRGKTASSIFVKRVTETRGWKDELERVGKGVRSVMVLPAALVAFLLPLLPAFLYALRARDERKALDRMNLRRLLSFRDRPDGYADLDARSWQTRLENRRFAGVQLLSTLAFVAGVAAAPAALATRASLPAEMFVMAFVAGVQLALSGIMGTLLALSGSEANGLGLEGHWALLKERRFGFKWSV